ADLLAIAAGDLLFFSPVGEMPNEGSQEWVSSEEGLSLDPGRDPERQYRQEDRSTNWRLGLCVLSHENDDNLFGPRSIRRSATLHRATCLNYLLVPSHRAEGG